MTLFDIVMYDINRRLFIVIYYYFELTPSSELRQLPLTRHLKFNYYTPLFSEDTISNIFEFL